jgi:hypothetical protein
VIIVNINVARELALRFRYSPLWLAATIIFGVAYSLNPAYSQDQNAQPSASQASTSAESDEALLKASQNPVADLISVPIQNNINFGIAPYGRVQNVISLQPVIPLNLSDNWMLITRIIQPIVWQPYPDQKTGGVFGLGDMNPTFFLAPKHPGALIWGLGPAVVIPTATSQILGQGKLDLGPSAVVLAQPGPWTVGALVSNVWSVAGSGGRPPVNRMALQYFVVYNLPHDWYLNSGPTITADRRASAGNVWTVPFGMGVGKLVNIGKAPVDFSGTFYGNATTPAGMPPWSMSLQVTLLFPKGSK